MASPKWPTSDKARLLTKPGIKRLDGPAKVKGEAKYAYDINRPQMLIAKILSCPHPNATIRAIDISAAQKMPGVRAISIMTGPGADGVSAQSAKLNPQWEGFEIAAVAADTPPGMEHRSGGSISMSLSGENEDELRGYWQKLSDGATIAMPLEAAPWGDTFGMLTDKFGVTWMVNVTKPQS